jgi:3',5'-cyclic AMP phosphodiesterase CpdA
MRIVATSDTHFDFDPSDWPEADVFIHAGDLMYTGQVDEWKGKLDSLKVVKAKHKYYVPGNHDYYPFHFEGLASSQLRREAKVKMIRPHDPIITLPDSTLKVLGVPYVTGLPGWAYNVSEDWLLDWLREVTAGTRADVVVSHAPMYEMLDAIRPLAATRREQEHVGGLAMNRWFHELDDRNRPLVWINGHIHESYGHEFYEGCHFYNVAHCDRNYDQNNQPMVIEI